MAKIVQINKRSGFYIRISVPSDLRPVLHTNAFQWKAGATRAEAVRNQGPLLSKAEKIFAERRSNDPVAAAFKEYESDPSGDHLDLSSLFEQHLKKAGLTPEQIKTVLYEQEQLVNERIQPVEIEPKFSSSIDARLSGQKPYTELLSMRLLEERPAPTTAARWKTALKALADWYGSEYLSEMTRIDAGNYKRHLLLRLKDSSAKTNINCLKAHWNWGIVNGYIKENIFSGLTKKLEASTKKDPLDQDLLQAGVVKAIDFNDINFFIQLSTGCRKGEHTGLRYSDVDLVNDWIHFKRYTYETPNGQTIIRELKGKKRDERSVPINKTLKTKLLKYLPEALTNNSDEPIWLSQYNPKDQTWGQKWASNFRLRYKFNSHQLRSYVITKLMMANVNPFILKEITRHSVGAMSDVVAGYVRPSESQLREVMNLLD